MKIYYDSSLWDKGKSICGSPQGDSLQFNSSIQYTEPPEDRFDPAANGL